MTLADKKSHRILQVQMQTSQPQPPILAYATDYFKLNQKVQVKARKPAMETREERLIPKPTGKTKSQTNGSNKSSKATFDKPMFDSEESEDDGDEEFATKLDAAVTPDNSKKNKKRKQQQNGDDEEDTEQVSSEPEKKKKKKGKGRKKAKKLNFDTAKDVQDQLVDFELSD